MKVKELMIDDWVKFRNTPRQINFIEIFESGDIVGCYNTEGWGDADEAKPIPLTEEILKANGFEIDEIDKDGDIVYQHKDFDFNNLNCIKYNGGDGFQFTVAKDGDEFQDNSVFIRCKYIHELQHALRLCQLNNLADNFKIE